MPDRLVCPRCRGPLASEGERLRCGCGTYPVVAGIPILTDWARDRRFTTEEALARHRPAARTAWGKLARRIAPGVARIGRAVADPQATFLGLLEAFGRESDLDYFRYRVGSPNWILSCAMLAPIGEGPVLDVACGAGHVARALCRKLPADRVVGIDLNFALLYLARRFVAPGCAFVCADASRPLPFADGTFETAVAADAFRYFPDPAAAARDLMRVARGPILLPVLIDPPPAPVRLSPDLFARALADRTPRFYPDRALLGGFLNDRRLDLRRPEAPPGEALSLAAGVDLRVYEGADFFAGGSTINPVYEVREAGESLHLSRRPLPEALARAYRECGEALPETLTVTRAQVAGGDPDLVRRFVLVDPC
jgi:SAM-dependent methyltransferase